MWSHKNPTLSPILMESGTRKRAGRAARRAARETRVAFDAGDSRRRPAEEEIAQVQHPPTRNAASREKPSPLSVLQCVAGRKVHSSDAALSTFGSSDSTPKGSIDLRLVVRIDRYTKADNPRRFSINLGEQQRSELRARTAADAERWITVGYF